MEGHSLAELFVTRCMTVAKKYHIAAARLGRERAEGKDESVDVSFGLSKAETQRPYLENFAEEILDGRVSEGQIGLRAKMYGLRVFETANEAWLRAQEDDQLYCWVTKHDERVCCDCCELAKGSPYTRDQLIEMGIAGGSAHPLCRCEIVIAGEDKGCPELNPYCEENEEECHDHSLDATRYRF